MAKMGDLLAKVAKGEAMSFGDVAELQRIANETEQLAKRVNNLIDAAGNITVPGSWVQIYDNPLGAPAPSFTVPIPNSYRHLRIVGTLRSDISSTNGIGSSQGGDSVGFQVNGDTGNNYYSGRFRGYVESTGGGTWLASDQTGSTFLSLGGAVGNMAPANCFASIDYFIPNYATGQHFKTAMAYGMNVRNASSSGPNIELAAGHWASLSRIASIQLYPVFGTNWMAGSRITVYGLSE